MTPRLPDLTWVTTDPSDGQLHHPDLNDTAETDALEADGYLEGGVLTTCGLRTKKVHIPGVFTRLGQPRCTACCDHLGYPHGTGSPKNDTDCRALLALPEEADQ